MYNIHSHKSSKELTIRPHHQRSSSPSSDCSAAGLPRFGNSDWPNNNARSRSSRTNSLQLAVETRVNRLAMIARKKNNPLITMVGSHKVNHGYPLLKTKSSLVSSFCIWLKVTSGSHGVMKVQGLSGSMSQHISRIMVATEWTSPCLVLVCSGIVCLCPGRFNHDAVHFVWFCFVKKA